MSPNREVDTTDSWEIEQGAIGAHEDREKIEATNEESKVAITVKEQPNGVELQFMKLGMNLPGGYDIMHRKEFNSVDTAVSELERYAAMYDHEGTWFFEGAPLLH